MGALLKTSFFILNLFISLNGYSQERQIFHKTLGLDIIPILNLATGGQPGFNELEVIFTETIDQKLLRFKFSLNDKNIYGSNLIQSELVEDNAPSSLVYQINKYQVNKNVHLSVGVAKIISRNNIFLYYGLDLNLGLNRGWVNTIISERTLTSKVENLLQSKKEAIFFTGLTPIMGMRLPIGKRIFFGIELGIEVNYLFGDIYYLDKSLNYQKSNLGRLDFNPLKVINDISFGIKF